MKRKHFTAAERAEVWERWKRGEGLIEIGRALGRRHSCEQAPMGAPPTVAKSTQ